MKIHEFQGKEIFRKYGVPTPRGIVAKTPEAAEAAAKELGTKITVVKAQIHAGGRGKGGGVKLAKSPAEAKAHAQALIGMMLKTHQTGPEGQKVRTLYVEEGLDIARELYLGLTLDRATSRNTFMVSAEGGVEIEEVASKHPEKILREAVDPAVGLQDFQGRKMAAFLGLQGVSEHAAEQTDVVAQWLVLVVGGGRVVGRQGGHGIAVANRRAAMVTQASRRMPASPLTTS